MVAGKILSFQIDVRGESEGARKIAELDQSLAKLNEERRKSLKISKESDAAAKKQVKNISALNAKITEGKRERTKLIAEEKRLTKAFQAGDGSVTKLRIKMQTLKATMEKLNLTTKAGQREFKRLNAQYQRGTGVLRKYDQRLSGSTRLQGAFTKGITNSFKSLAVGLIGITAVIRVFREVVKITGDFDKATAKLASVTGKTREEIADLTDQSKELGAVTQFTAGQVASLQIELAKLGFTANEISLATPSILSFATATGANLAAAAKTAGAALRIFGLSALETEDAVATLAVATTKSGLTFEAYDTILSTAGPVAKAYGFELADVIALTGELASKGFEANKAATATRNILLNLADANGELAKKLGGAATTFDGLIDGLIRADDEGISLTETLELTDKRSVAAFSTFLEGAESARELREGIVDVNKELQIMVDKQLDTLAGDVDLLKSAFQGLVLSLDSVGVFRGAVQFLTDFTLKISNLSLITTKFNKQTQEELTKTFDLLIAITDKQGDHFSQMLEFFDDLSDEQLLSRGLEQMAKDFAQIRKLNVKEGRALAEEYLRRREEIAQKEIEVEADKQVRILKQEEDARKKSLADARLAQAKIDKAAEKKSAKEREKEQEKLNKALENTVGLLSRIKEIEDLSELSVFNLVTGEFNVEDIEKEILDISGLYDDFFEDLQKADEKRTQEFRRNTDERFDHEDERARQTAELIKQIEQEKINLSADGANEIFNIGSGLVSRQQQKLEEQLKNEQITEEKFAEEKAKLRRKQAAIDKIQALFNIALNTAIAVSSALTPLTLPLVPFIIGLGALQVAAVLAEPLPAFAKGGVIDTDGSGGKVKSGYEMPWATPQGDNTLALLKPREVILNESQQMALGGSDTFRRIGVPGFAAGGAIGAPQPPVSGIDLLSLASAFAAAVNDKNVVLNVNELNAAEGDLAVINSTNEL